MRKAEIIRKTSETNISVKINLDGSGKTSLSTGLPFLEHMGSSDTLTADLAFRRLMAMGRTKMMDRLFRAADGHSKSIPGVVAKEFSARAVSTLSHPQRLVMELRLGIRNSTSATPADTADSLGISLNDVREFELTGWQSIHSPIQLDID